MSQKVPFEFTNIELQLEEFQTIQTIYDRKLICDTSLVHSLTSFVVKRDETLDSPSPNRKPVKPPVLKFTVFIADELCVECVLPSSYPSHCAPAIKLRASPAKTKTSKSFIEKINRALPSRIHQQFEKNNLVLFDLIDWIQEQYLCLLDCLDNDTSTSCTTADPPMPLILQRSFVWFHHINNKAKRTDCLAKKYALNGFCVTGKPGVVVLEGRSENVNAFLAEIKQWSWKRMILRHSESESYSDEHALACNQKYSSWTFHRLSMKQKGGMKVVHALLKNVNLEHHYKTIVHINDANTPFYDQ